MIFNPIRNRFLNRPQKNWKSGSQTIDERLDLWQTREKKVIFRIGRSSISVWKGLDKKKPVPQVLKRPLATILQIGGCRVFSRIGFLEVFGGGSKKCQKNWKKLQKNWKNWKKSIENRNNWKSASVRKIQKSANPKNVKKRSRNVAPRKSLFCVLKVFAHPHKIWAIENDVFNRFSGSAGALCFCPIKSIFFNFFDVFLGPFFSTCSRRAKSMHPKINWKPIRNRAWKLDQN